MIDRTCLAVVLAAGEGTRMRSSRPKVMHEVAGAPMLQHVLAATAGLEGARRAVVVGPDMEAVAAHVHGFDQSARVFVQAERRGTAHAVLSARAALEEGADSVLVLFGDTPLVTGETLARLHAAIAGGADIAVLGFRTPEPKGYGRLVMRDGKLEAIREERDASEEERRITFCNGGIMGFAGRHMPALIDRIDDDNAKGEFYLTDAVALANEAGLSVVALEGAAEEVLGVNDRTQLAAANAVLQDRLRRKAMENGATLVAPETVFLSADTRLGRDVVVEPNVIFGPGVTVEEGAVIRAFSHLEGARVGREASVGPFARLRPGADLGEETRIGNFVEVKAARLEAGAKANHLTYIGDSHVGAGANVGAGTITCNYDGFFKHRTEIGAGAFIGSNSSLVAPVRIGEGAYIGSGSVITGDVHADALALGRGRQVEKEGWGRTFRHDMAAKKAASAGVGHD